LSKTEKLAPVAVAHHLIPITWLVDPVSV